MTKPPAANVVCLDRLRKIIKKIEVAGFRVQCVVIVRMVEPWPDGDGNISHEFVASE